MYRIKEMNEKLFTQFMLLPEPLQLLIIQNLSAADLAEFAQASKYTDDFVKRHELWEYRLEQDFFNGKKCEHRKDGKSAQVYYQSLCSELKKDVEELIDLDAMKPNIFGSLRAIVAKPEGPNADQIKSQAEELLHCMDSIINWNQLPDKERYNEAAKAHYAYRKIIRGLSHGQLPYSKTINTRFIKLIIGNEFNRTLKGLLSAYKDEDIIHVLKEDNFELFLKLIELNEHERLGEIFSRKSFSSEYPHRLEALMARGHDALAIASKSDNTELFVFVLASYPSLNDRYDALRFSNYSIFRNSSANAMKVLLQEDFYKNNSLNLDAALSFSNHHALCKSVGEGDFARVNLMIESYSTQELFNEGLFKLEPIASLSYSSHESIPKHIMYTLLKLSILYISMNLGVLFLIPTVVAVLMRFVNVRQVGMFINSFFLGASIVSNRVLEEVIEDAPVSPMSLNTFKRLMLGSPGMLIGFCLSLAISAPIMVYNIAKQTILSIHEGFLAFSNVSTSEHNDRTWRQKAVGGPGYAVGSFLGGIVGLVILSFDYIKTIYEHRSSDTMTLAIELQPLRHIDNSSKSIVSINEPSSMLVMQDCAIDQQSTAVNKL
jgi:hypothetical protein